MNDQLVRALKKAIREEILRTLEAEKRVPHGSPATPRPNVELPLRPGEVERHYPVIEVARLLGMSRDWVYERMADGTFVVANFGTGKSKRRIPASSLNTYIASRTYRS